MPFAIATHAVARVSTPHARTPNNLPAKLSAAPRSAPLPRASRGASVVTRGLNTDKSYNCVVNNEGVIISDDFPSGTYEVTSWWHGSTDEEEALAPRCDSERQRGCEVRCEMTAEGELVCEGLTSGTYKVVNAAEAGADCQASADGFECQTSWDEDEKTKPVSQDVGDLDLQEKEGNQGVRLGG